MRRLAVALAIGCLLAASSPALASVAAALELPELVRRSDVILVGTVTEQHAHYNGRGQIVTDVTIQVQQPMKGDVAAGQTVALRCLGGEVDGVGMRVTGEPTFETGTRTLLFARQSEMSGMLRPVGMSQGAMPVRADGGQSMVHPGGEGLSLVRRGSGGNLRAAPGALLERRPLSEMEDRIQGLMATEGSK